MKLNKVEALPPGVHSLHDLLKHQRKPQGPEFLAMGWTVVCSHNCHSDPQLYQEVFAVTESKPATAKFSEKPERKKFTRKRCRELELTQSLHLAYNIPKDQEELWEKCTEDIL